MNYSFAPHLRAICWAGGVEEPRATLFALVDAARLDPSARKRLGNLRDVPTELLFDSSFARSALHLSPLLFELSPNLNRIEQMLILDRACAEFPMLSFIRSPLSLADLVTHLRSVLLIEAESVPYLLRYADTQMMAAANNAFGPSQRAVFFHDIEAWFTVDYRGVLDNVADSGSHLQDDHVAGQPIVFDAEQTSRLLRAVAIPVLASQLRNLESLFGVALTHAEQSAFAARCLADGGAATDNDAELVSLAVKCWRREAPQPGATR